MTNPSPADALRAHYQDVKTRLGYRQIIAPLPAPPKQTDPTPVVAPPDWRSVPVRLRAHKIWPIVRRYIEESGMDWEKIVDPCRKKDLVECRQAVAWILAHATPWPSVLIGRMMRRDHTTILSNVYIVSERIKKDPNYLPTWFIEYIDSVDIERQSKFVKSRKSA